MPNRPVSKVPASGVEPPTERGRPNARSSTPAGAGAVDGRIRAEWHTLEKVVVHRPGVEMFFGLMEPLAADYGRSFSQAGAVREHEELEHVLGAEFGVEVIRLADAITDAAARNPRVRDRLVEAAERAITYRGAARDVAQARRDFEADAPHLDPLHFLQLLVLQPEIAVGRAAGTRAVSFSVAVRCPLSNLYYMRDQQFVTDVGIVMSRMAKPARRHEPEVTRFLWEEALGLPVVHETRVPGTIEGGEFMPLGDAALVGVGERTSPAAVEQLLGVGVGFEEIGVVHPASYPMLLGKRPDPMLNMHLDTYFNVASSNVAVGLVALWQASRVEVWRNEGDGRFTRSARDTNLFDWITGRGFDVVPITTLEQLAHATNFLCVRDGAIVAIDAERHAGDVLAHLRRMAAGDPGRFGPLLGQAERDAEDLSRSGEFFPHKPALDRHGIQVRPIVLRNLAGGLGGAHCMTCALTRSG